MGDTDTNASNNDHLVQSDDPNHPANLIPELCKRFYQWGWVTGMAAGDVKFQPPYPLTLPRYWRWHLNQDFRLCLHRSIRGSKGAHEVREYICA